MSPCQPDWRRGARLGRLRRAAGRSLPRLFDDPQHILLEHPVAAAEAGMAIQVQTMFLDEPRADGVAKAVMRPRRPPRWQLDTACGSLRATAISPSFRRPISCPDTTTVPSGSIISSSTPSLGAGTSKTTLSVSISTTGFVAPHRLAGLFVPAADMVPSATDSGNPGTLSSIAMLFPCRS